MTIEHRVIPEGNLHEPKGVSTALANTVYVANGAGSGVWKTLNPVTHSFGSMLVPDPGNGSLLFPPITDKTLGTASQFILLTGSGIPFQSGPSARVSFSTNRLTVSVGGVYQVHFDATISATHNDPSNYPVYFAVRFRKSGGTFSGLKSITSINSLHAPQHLALTELFSLNSGDYIQLVAATSSPTQQLVRFHNISCLLSLVS